MTEKIKNDSKRRWSYRRIALYGCGFLVFASCVLLGVILRLVSDIMKHGFGIVGPGAAECADPGEYRQFTTSGHVVDQWGEPLPDAQIEVGSEELKDMISMKASDSQMVFCEHHYLHPISTTTNKSGVFQFDPYRATYWDTLYVSGSAEDCNLYQSIIYDIDDKDLTLQSYDKDLTIVLECTLPSTTEEPS